MEQEKRIIDPPSSVKDKKGSFYLPSLDALRGIACLTIVAVHVEQHKDPKHMPPFMDVHQLYNIARPSLLMFFVLSGFLITLLLLKEFSKTNTISLKNFYMKRVLRIWPLYYFVLIGSALLWQYTPPLPTFALCMTFFPNIAYYLGIPWETSPPQWTIGVEEQFYIFWPLLVLFFRKQLLPVMLIFAIGYTMLPHGLLFTLARLDGTSQELIQFVDRFFFGTKFNLLALGGITAYFWHKGYRPFIFTNKAVSAVILILPFVFWFSGTVLPIFTDEVFGLLFALLIFRLSTMQKAPYILENPVSIYVGKISYGVYMYHYTVLMIFFSIHHMFEFEKAWTFNLAAYGFTYVGTLGLAALSFHTLEKYFLGLKDKFSR